MLGASGLESSRRILVGGLAVRLALGVALAVSLPPICVDDYFRVYHAIFFWQKPSFSPSAIWLPVSAWIHGTVLGLLGDARFVPRLLSLALGMAGAYFGASDTESAPERWARVAVACCLPTSVLLFSSPLSEALFGALLMVHVALLTRYRRDRRALDLLGATLTLLAAVGTRYEAWVLLPFSVCVAVATPCVDLRRGIAATLACLPLAFPPRWILHVEARTAEPLGFLEAIARDHFGPSPLAAMMLGPNIPIVVGSLAACAFLFWDLRRPPRARLSSAFGVLLCVLIAVLVYRRSLPSQLPVRLLHLPAVLAVPALVEHLRLARMPGRTAALCGITVALGVWAAFSYPSIVPRDEVALGEALHERLMAHREATAVVSGPFPASALHVVQANAVGRVFVEGAGGRCANHALRCSFRCGRPPWVARVRYLVVEPGPEHARLLGAGYVERARSRTVRLLERPAHVPTLCTPPS